MCLGLQTVYSIQNFELNFLYFSSLSGVVQPPTRLILLYLIILITGENYFRRFLDGDRKCSLEVG
jgi:hypothetical protein